MKRYLSQIPLAQAITLLTDSFSRPQRTEILPVEEAAGRIIASPVYATDTVPAVRIAAMDGIAVRSEDTAPAQDQRPGELTEAILVSTGQEIPDRYDAVIPSEEICFSGEGKYLVRRPARPNQYIRRPGEEISQGRLILQSGHRIIPSDIGALLTYGVREVEVRSLIVGLIPTGDELIPGFEDPKPGQVRESNTAILTADLFQAGARPIRYGIVPDDPDLIREAITAAWEACDLIVISAGSSGGSRDHTREVIGQLGTVLFHGVAMRPGKTLLCGMIKEKPVIGLPGQPMAALTAWREVVSTLLTSWGFGLSTCPECIARTAEPISSDGGIDEFVPVSVIRVQQKDIVLPRPRGAAGQMQGISSNAILHIPASKEGYQEGAMVRVRLIRQPCGEPGILIAGESDTLTDYLQARFSLETCSLIFRPLSAVWAAAALCKGTCHGIILAESDLRQDTEITRILLAGCSDRIRSLGIGSKNNEQILLVFCDIAPIEEELSSLLRFLSSPEWRESGHFPDGTSSEGAGMSGDVIIPETCRENRMHHSTGSISRV